MLTPEEDAEEDISGFGIPSTGQKLASFSRPHWGQYQRLLSPSASAEQQIRQTDRISNQLRIFRHFFIFLTSPFASQSADLYPKTNGPHLFCFRHDSPLATLISWQTGIDIIILYYIRSIQVSLSSSRFYSSDLKKKQPGHSGRSLTYKQNHSS